MPVIATPVETPQAFPPGGVPETVCEVPATPTTGQTSACDTPIKEPSIGNQCFFDCDEIFGNIHVFPTIMHGTRVEWSLHPNIRDPGPYTFQLQAGRTAHNDADDWTPVGSSAQDVFFMEDDTQRVYGKTQWTHYRICLTTPLATYFSRPQHAHGDLSRRHRREWAEIVRAWDINLRMEAGTEGYLLKQRLFGTPCPAGCRDWSTDTITNPQCVECLGTGFLKGYFDPIPCVYAAMARKVTHNEMDGMKGRGTVDDHLRVRAYMLATPMPFENDVWIEKQSDNRWYVHKIQHHVEKLHIPAVLDVELRLAPFSDVIYNVEIPDQIPS